VKVDLDALAPEERRIILVASDDTYRRLTQQIDWKAVAKMVAVRLMPGLALVPIVSAVIGERLARNGYLLPTWTRPLSTPLRTGELPIPHVGPADAARRFRFDHLPHDGAAYVLNPMRADHYVRPAEINERIAQEKLSAFLRLCAALGAEEVIVTSGETIDRDGGGRLSSPLPDAAGQIGLHATFRSASQVERGVVARFDAPKEQPHVPEDLRSFLAIDPIVEGMARSRLEHGLREQACTLTFNDAVDIGSEVCLALEGKGIDVGGRYRSLSASRWSFVVRFHERRSADR
jgi:hypothetical protein